MSGIYDILSTWLRAAVGVALPHTCMLCDRELTANERYVCEGCLLQLPRHKVRPRNEEMLADRLLLHTPEVRVRTWFAYHQHSLSSQLITVPKYSDRPSVSRYLGERFARELLHGDAAFFDGVEAIVPVPVSRMTMLKRGFNQSAEIARGISRVSGVPVLDVLTKADGMSKHKNMHRDERLRTVDTEDLGVRDKYMQDFRQHIAIVDDVITTGATAEIATRALTRCLPEPPAVTVLALASTVSRS